MLKIDGVDIPTPTEYKMDYEEISDADRNANGLMIKEAITYKYKLNLAWKVLDPSEMTKLMQAKNKNFFQASFINLENRRETRTFYAGTPSATGMQYKNGRIVKWLDITMNIIER